MGKWWVFALVIIILVLGSLFFPYLLLQVYSWFTFDKIVFTQANYVQTVSSVMSFFVATSISYSVYQITIQREKRERRQSAHEICAIFEESMHIIDMEVQSLSNASSGDFRAIYSCGKLLYSLKLTNDDRNILFNVLREIKRIDREKNGNGNVHALCENLNKNCIYPKCKDIIEKIKKQQA